MGVILLIKGVTIIEINKLLKAKRQELSLTQEQVAEKIYVSQKSVSNWETGKTYPDIESLVRLATLYELSLDNLLLEEPKAVEASTEQTKRTVLKKLSLFPFLTIIVLVIILLGQKWWGELSEEVSLLISLAVVLNLVPLYSLTKKEIGETKNSSDQASRLKNNGRLVFIVLVTIIGCFLIYKVPSLVSD
ncbi:helix-turn-helix transcriptional regulator [Vagococcus sp. PNs007]|uniref:Helix-turn-helix transcriptional regulator n=1 Tax=Vagococcus proximus TaxID=2991417 RepID=A0ABT5X1T4_9ENTE|nr:helix-turn-helix transcriptional regulator [Vagococcus proximus]MDF0479877.1 helix-turn-helix transcriptional regulator [Vagococcus proximus]